MELGAYNYNSNEMLVQRIARIKPLEAWNYQEKEFWINNKYSDISIRVGGALFKLHRIILSLKSNYFEKLFTSNFVEKDLKEIEIDAIDEQVFADITEVIYDKASLDAIITDENFVSLFIAINYLELENINENSFEYFIKYRSSWHAYEFDSPCSEDVEDVLTHEREDFSQMLKLHDFLIAHPHYKGLLDCVRTIFSRFLPKISELDEFCGWPLVELENIIKFQSSCTAFETDRICAKWICVDINERLKHSVRLANAVRYRYNIWYQEIGEKEHDIHSLMHNDKDIMLRNVQQYLTKLRTSYGELDSSDQGLERIVKRIWKQKETFQQDTWEKNYKRKKIKLFLNEYFYDAMIKVGKKTFRLHRIILASASKYFDELFSNSSNSDIQEIQIPDEIDEITFHTIILYIYNFKIELTPNTNFIGLLQASALFELEVLFLECENYLDRNWKLVDKIFEILIFASEKSFFKLYEHGMTYVLQNISKEKHFPSFYRIPFDLLEEIFVAYEFSAEDEVINMCTKWIAYDKEKRYHYIPQLAFMINRSQRIKSLKYDMEYKGDITEIGDENEIKRKIIKIFYETKLLTSTVSGTILTDEKKPFFMISCEDAKHHEKCISFKNINWEAITDLPPLFLHSNFTSESYLTGNRYNGVEAAAVFEENLLISNTSSRNINFSFYNFSSNKFHSLASYSCDYNIENDALALLICNNQIYSCRSSGTVRRYLPKLNRWCLLHHSSSAVKHFYTSDDKRLFQITRPIGSEHHANFHRGTSSSWRIGLRPLISQRNEITRPVGSEHHVSFYDERSSSWKMLPIIPLKNEIVEDISVIDQNLCALFPSHVLTLDERAHKWMEIANSVEVMAQCGTTSRSESCFKINSMKQNKNEIMYIIDKSLFSFSKSSNTWVLKEENIPTFTGMVHFNN